MFLFSAVWCYPVNRFDSTLILLILGTSTRAEFSTAATRKSLRPRNDSKFRSGLDAEHHNSDGEEITTSSKKRKRQSKTHTEQQEAAGWDDGDDDDDDDDYNNADEEEESGDEEAEATEQEDGEGPDITNEEVIYLCLAIEDSDNHIIYRLPMLYHLSCLQGHEMGMGKVRVKQRRSSVFETKQESGLRLQTVQK